MTAALLAFAHHVAFYAIIVALVVEMLRVRVDMTLADLNHVRIVDAIYGVAAFVLIVAGVLRVMYFEKGADYYLHNSLFLAKMGLLIAVGLLSIYPTVRYIVWAKRITNGELSTLPANEVKLTRVIIHAELTGIALVMLCAALMAKGIG